MFHLLDKVQQGLLDPTVFAALECNKRASSLDLSVACDIEPVYDSGVNCMEIDPLEGHYMLSGCSDGSIYIHSLCNETKSSKYVCKVVCRADNHSHRFSIETVQWYPPDTGIFITSGMGGAVKVWSTNAFVPVEVYKLNRKIYQHHMSKSSGNSIIAVASALRNVTLIDMRIGSEIHTLVGHSSTVLTCHWSPRDDFILATGGQDHKLKLWDIRSSRACLASLDRHNGNVRTYLGAQSAHEGAVNGLAFSSDGLHLISLGTDNHVRLWDALTAKRLFVNYGTIVNKSRRKVQICTSSNCNPEIIFVPSDGKIFTYNMISGEVINALSGHNGTVRCCAFHPFMPVLYSGSSDRTVLAWEYNETSTRGISDYKSTSRKCFTSADFSGTQVSLLDDTDAWSEDEGES